MLFYAAALFAIVFVVALLGLGGLLVGAALAQFENEGGASARRPAPTRKVIASRSDK
jgi:hypothetical protein